MLASKWFCIGCCIFQKTSELKAKLSLAPFANESLLKTYSFVAFLSCFSLCLSCLLLSCPLLSSLLSLLLLSFFFFSLVFPIFSSSVLPPRLLYALLFSFFPDHLFCSPVFAPLPLFLCSSSAPSLTFFVLLFLFPLLSYLLLSSSRAPGPKGGRPPLPIGNIYI